MIIMNIYDYVVKILITIKCLKGQKQGKGLIGEIGRISAQLPGN